MAGYTLPDMPYDYSALEPHISAQVLELHHSKHHAAYVAGANETLEKLATAREKNDFGSVTGLEKSLAFHTSGHVLHSMFWENMSPDGGDKPDGVLGNAIDEHFGNFDQFKNHLTAVCMTMQGSGWGALVWEPLGQRLLIEQIYDHQNNFTQASTPILVIDAWEHAYYLQYKNVKADFFSAVWNTLNWEDAARRLAAAQGKPSA